MAVLQPVCLPQEVHGRTAHSKRYNYRQIHHALTEFLFNSRHIVRGDEEVLQNAILFISQHSLWLT
jgi:hypothetical protein